MGNLRTNGGRVLAVLFLLAAVACNMPRRGTEGSGPDYVFTAAARTVEAQLTQVSGPFPTVQPGTPAAPTAVVTPTPGAGTPATSGCDQAGFVDDITYPDDTDVAPGAKFIKIWRLKNTGTCPWGAGYAVVFASGDAMGAPPSAVLPRVVAPGEEVDLSVEMTAPDAAGTYRGDFMLRNAAGQQFGIGTEGRSFWVQVEVIGGTGLVVDFIDLVDEAVWASGVTRADGTGTSANITFGGTDDDPNGTAKLLSGATLENGATFDTVLLTYPRREEGGWVTGLFPEYTVQAGDHLRARLGFLAGPNGECGQGSVQYRFYYLEGETLTLLQGWSKTCNKTLIPVDIDLSGLQGKTVRFAFSLGAEGPAVDDWAAWYAPRIER